MFSLVQNKYSPIIDGFRKESGDRSSPIWLIVNPKFPSVRQEVWIPILEVIQDMVYRKLHNRIGTEHIFIKNTLNDLGAVPKASNKEATKEINILKESILKFQPKILITFGPLTYELINRLIEQRPEKDPGYWGSTNLELEFEHSISNFDINKINKIPLVRRIRKNGKNIEEHNCSFWEENDSYFQEVGTKIAARIIENKDSLNIWV